LVSDMTGGFGSVSADRAAVRLTVFAALRLEQLAVRRGLEAAARASGSDRTQVLRCGLAAGRLETIVRQTGSVHSNAQAVVVAGVGGAVSPDLRPGDVVVATEVRDCQGRRIELPGAAPLIAALRDLKFTVHSGPIQTTATIVHGEARAKLAATGVLAVDMESSHVLTALWLEDVASHSPTTSLPQVISLPGAAVVRVIVDTPQRPLARVGTVTAGLQALRILQQSAPALLAWSEAVGERALVLAAPRSFCAGVERAIDIVERALDRYPGPIYVRRQIVHNAHVVARLESRGAVFVHELDEVPEQAMVILSAHGVAPAVRREAERRQLTVIDATCPLVAKVHSEARRFAGRGDTVLLVGHPNHDETEGTLGESPEHIRLVPDLETARTIAVDDPRAVAYVTQTTLATDEAAAITEVLQERFPTISAPPSEDICYATTNRQQAVREISASVDVVLVIGSQNSSNSKRLAEVAERSGVPAYLIEDASGIRPQWLRAASRVGLTAGASAPPELVDEVVRMLSGLGRVTVQEVRVAQEELTFTLPKEVDG